MSCTITLTDDELVEKIINQIHNCDADTLAAYAESVLGCTAEYIDENGNYELTPNENWVG